MPCIPPGPGCNDTANKIWYPECYASDPNSVTDWAPYINCALVDARTQGGGTGKVVLGAKGIANYLYVSTIYVGDVNEVDVTGVTLQGQNGATLSLQAGFPGGSSALLYSNSIIDSVLFHGNGVKDPAGGIIAGIGGAGPDGGSSNWHIRNCTVNNFSGIGVNFAVGRNSCEVINCTISNNGNAGIQNGNRCANCTISSNHVFGNGYNGIDNAGGTYTGISGNVVHDNGATSAHDPADPYDRHGILLAFAGPGEQSSHNVADGNTCYNNYGAGIVVAGTGGGTVDSNTLGNNECYGNAGADPTTGNAGINLWGGVTNTYVGPSNNSHNNVGYGVAVSGTVGPGNEVAWNRLCANIQGDIWAPGCSVHDNTGC